MKAKEKAIDYWSKIGFITKRQLHPDIEKGIDIAIQEAKKEVFDTFDKYACIKNDKWYLKLKRKTFIKKE